MDLADLQAGGVLELLDVEMARALARAGGQRDARVELAIALVSRNVRRGHTCFPLETTLQDIWPHHAATSQALPTARQWRQTLRQSRLADDGPLVVDAHDRLYFRRHWQLERDVAASLASRSKQPWATGIDSRWLATALDRLFGVDGAAPQRAAAKNALEHRVSLLCGGPGTGKTTAVAAVVALLIESALSQRGPAPKVMLLAPTGKSAARLGEAVARAKARIDASEMVLDAIPARATTIHQALGMQRTGLSFRRNADHPLDANVIVIDEASMVDLALMRQLLDATPRDANLLIVGDPDQLTSVEAGSVLRDLVTASSQTWWKDRVTILTRAFRYPEDQPLGRLVEAIRSGDSALVEQLLSAPEAGDVASVGLEQLDAELDRAATRFSDTVRATEPAAHFARRSRFVVLTPYRVGPTGTRQLGAAIEARLPRRAGSPRVTPIMIERNSDELEVHNGDFAMLLDTNPPQAVIQHVTDGFRTVAEARLPEYTKAFALSVHKAQGSEFDEVLVVLPETDAPLLTRELLYTAVSRARQRLRIVGPKEVLYAALQRKAQRHSGLVDAIAAARRAAS